MNNGHIECKKVNTPCDRTNLNLDTEKCNNSFL